MSFNKRNKLRKKDRRLQMAVGKLVVSNPSKRDHLIRLMEGSDIEYPDLYMDVHIEGDISEQQAFAKMFAPSKCKSARSPMDRDPSSPTPK